MNRATDGLVPVAAAILALVVLNWTWKKEPVNVPRLDTNYDMTVITTLPPKYVMPLKTNEVSSSAWALAKTDADQILGKYLPNATEEQKLAAQKWVFDARNRRAKWASEAAEIQTKADQLNDPAVSETMRIEVGRVIDTDWASFTASVKGMAKQLDEANEKVFSVYGFTDPNLQSDLRAVANPPGKEPWEE